VLALCKGQTITSLEKGNVKKDRRRAEKMGELREKSTMSGRIHGFRVDISVIKIWLLVDREGVKEMKKIAKRTSRERKKCQHKSTNMQPQTGSRTFDEAKRPA